MTEDSLLIAVEKRLRMALAPTHLEVIDDSAYHKGHQGSQHGAAHLTVVIAAQALQGKPMVEAHRQIYTVLQDMIPYPIHALRIRIVPEQYA